MNPKPYIQKANNTSDKGKNKSRSIMDGRWMLIECSKNGERIDVNTTAISAASFESPTFSKTPTNVPAFHAWSNNVTTHSLSDATETKVTFLNSETFTR